MSAIKAPAGISYALTLTGQLNLIPEDKASILIPADFLKEKVPAGSVLLDGRVTDSIKDPFPVRGKLGIREPSERKKGLRSHGTFNDMDVGRSDESGTVLRLFL